VGLRDYLGRVFRRGTGGLSSQRAIRARRGGYQSMLDREATVDDLADLRRFVTSRRGVEFYVEPETAATDTTAGAVAYDGEWIRRRVGSPAVVRKLAAELLEALRLTPFSSTISKNLPYGAQRRLEIARALATRPELLLLDEPADGMHPLESDELMEMIRWIQKEYRLTILLIEHDMKVVMGMCERILVMENGALIAEGAPARVRSDPAVIAAYLGEPEP